MFIQMPKHVIKTQKLLKESEIKNEISEINNTLQKINSRLDETKE